MTFLKIKWSTSEEKPKMGLGRVCRGDAVPPMYLPILSPQCQTGGADPEEKLRNFYHLVKSVSWHGLPCRWQTGTLSCDCLGVGSVTPFISFFFEKNEPFQISRITLYTLLQSLWKILWKWRIMVRILRYIRFCYVTSYKQNFCWNVGKLAKY